MGEFDPMRPYKLFALAVASLLLVACGGTAQPQEPAPAGDVIEATFVCSDGTGIDAVFDNAAGTVTITLPDDTLTLSQAESASGARYSDGTTTFWNKGDEAFVQVDGETIYDACTAAD
jgi:membrane-bound inhibitor of C-type lysozyme